MRDDLRRILIEADVEAMRTVWARVSPHLPQPQNRREVEIMMHSARTQARIPLKLRAWSHRWLCDHGLPSGLPDELKDKAERLYPRVVEGVGIAVIAGSALMKPIVEPIRDAIVDAVNEAYAEGRTDLAHVRARMQEARELVVRKLVGRR